MIEPGQKREFTPVDLLSSILLSLAKGMRDEGDKTRGEQEEQVGKSFAFYLAANAMEQVYLEFQRQVLGNKIDNPT